VPSIGGTESTVPSAVPASPGSNVDADGAAALLDRMDVLVNAALGAKKAPSADKPVGTSGVASGVDSKSSAGRVTVDRAALDELLAEVQQLRSMLRVVTK
jgi:hypothetical protein